MKQLLQGARALLVRTGRGMAYAGYVISHPIRGFYEMRFEGKGSMPGCIALLALVCLAYVESILLGGPAFVQVNIRTFNLLMALAAVLIPFFLWCGANWSITALMDGEGKFSHIFMASCYALTPYLITTVLWILLSNVLTQSDSSFLSMIQTVGLVISFFLFFTGMVTVHQFTVKKAIGALILTVAFMAFIAFLSTLFLNVFNRLIQFIAGLVTELRLRM